MSRRTPEGPPAPDHAWTPEDSVDALIASWRERRTDLDFAPIGVLTRLARVRRHVEVELERVFAEHDLDATTFAVLVTLERLGGGGGAVARAALMEDLGMPTAVVEARLNSLTGAGLASDTGGGVALTAE